MAPSRVLAVTTFALVGSSCSQPSSGVSQRAAFDQELRESAQQIAWRQNWIDVRLPPEHINGSISDSGQTWDCIDITRQAGFRLNELLRAEFSARLVDEATESDRTISDDEVLSLTDAEFADAKYAEVQDYDAVGAAALLASAFAEIAEMDKSQPYGVTDSGDVVESEMGIDSSCQPGYVPVSRVTLDDIERAGSLAAYLYPPPPNFDTSWHAVVTDDFPRVGARATINTWSPFVQIPPDWEFSLAQMWLYRGSASDNQTIEFGWHKYVTFHSDFDVHLFVYSTSDNYASGCYNDLCGRWVQTAGQVAPGATMPNVSVLNGTQVSREYEIARGTSTGNWFFKFAGNTIGYYPTSLFDTNGIKNEARYVDFGGEVNDETVGQHTPTNMGSGHFPSEGLLGTSAYIRNIEVKDLNNVWVDYIKDSESDEPGCYEIESFVNGPSWGTYIYYGGYGYDSVACP